MTRRCHPPRLRGVLSALVTVAVWSSSSAHAEDEPPAPAPADEPAAPDHGDPLHGTFVLTPRIALVINTLYNSRGLLPGTYALYAVRPAIEGHQFLIAANNTTLGFGISGVSYRQFAITGGLDVNLKSGTPLSSPAVLAPQFYNASIRAHSDRLSIRIGEFPDVILPFIVRTTNGFPGTYIPGQLGAFRPQFRIDTRLPFGDSAQLSAGGSLGRPLQTFQVSDELLGVQAGLPDVQGRVAIDLGAMQEELDALWKRRYAIGVSGHAGRRRIVDVSTGDELTGTEVTTWSIGVDARAELPTHTALNFRLWRGAVVGDYMGGVFQTVSPTLAPIHAHGFLLAARQELGSAWSIAGGLGQDNPRDSDLAPGARALNAAWFVNTFWQWSRRIGFAVEGGRWRTEYLTQRTTRAWRVETMAIIRI